MKHIFCLLAVVLICTGCRVIKESSDSDNGNTTASDTIDGNISSTDTKEGKEDILMNSIVISKDDTGLMVAVADKNSSLRQFDPASVHYSDIPSLDVTIGAIVKIRYDGRIAESYPVQIWADKIEIIEKVQDNWPATSQIPKDYTREEAIEDNCFVLGIDKNQSVELLNSFVGNTKNGMAGYLRRVTYTDEGDPLITDFIYDGKKYYVFDDVSRDAFAGNGEKLYKKEYKYINSFEIDNGQVNYLADRNDITREEYEKSLSSSNSKDLLDTYLLSY